MTGKTILSLWIAFGLLCQCLHAQSPAETMDGHVALLKQHGSGPEDYASMVSSAAEMYFQEGRLDTAMERVLEALRLNRAHNLNNNNYMPLSTAGKILAKEDDEAAVAFLEEQFNAPDANAAYKKEVLTVLGQSLMGSGNLVTALQVLQAKLDLVREESPGSQEEAQALLEFGQSCMTARVYDIGVEALKKAQQLARKLKNPGIEAQAAYSVGVSMLANGEHESAEKVLRKAADDAAAGNDRMFLPSILVTLANTQIRMEKFDEAKKTLDDLGNKFKFNFMAAHSESMRSVILLAESLNSGDAKPALKQIVAAGLKAIEAKKISLRQGSSDDARKIALLPNYLAMAGYQMMLGDVAATKGALAMVKDAIGIMRRDYETAIKEGVMNRDEAQVMLAYQAAFASELEQQMLVNQKDFEQALVVAEQSRGQTQADLMRRALTDAKEKLAMILPEKMSIEDIKAVAAKQNTTIVFYSLVHALDQNTRFYFRATHPAANPHSIYTWVIAPDGEVNFRSTPLGQSMSALVEAARKDITTPVDPRKSNESKDADSDGNALRKLHQLLIEPIESLLPDDAEARVAIVPQGTLFLVPFAALNDADNRPLIVSHTLTTVPSVEALALSSKQFNVVKAAGKTGVLIVGNPTMPSIRRRPDEPAQQLSPLGGAEAEAVFLGKLLKVDPMIGAAATEVAVAKRMEEARYIHLATHGLLESENVYSQSYLSAIALAPTPNEDGFLTVRETMRMKLNAELVVLSACDTGRGRISGDGVIGLSRGFIAAGVPTVVVSLWPVSDAATKDLMSFYYTEMLKGTDKAAALRQAMLQTREKYPAAVAWAPFVLCGCGL